MTIPMGAASKMVRKRLSFSFNSARSTVFPLPDTETNRPIFSEPLVVEAGVSPDFKDAARGGFSGNFSCSIFF